MQNTDNADFGKTNWNSNAGLANKLELSYRIVQKLKSADEFNEFIDFLRRHDTQYYHQAGGDIHAAVTAGDAASAIEHLDERYLTLIQLHANFNLESALAFHTSAEGLYKNSGKSFVRYSRLTNSLSKTNQLLSDLEKRSLKSVSILPKHDASFQTEVIKLADANNHFSGIRNKDACRVELTLPQPRQRNFSHLSDRDDRERTDTMWICDILTNEINRLTFYTLPDTRICHQPTGISFEEAGERRFVHSMSDMYHYFRVAGKATFGSLEQQLEQAYVLPRYGINNYYHSLVDKLPGLYGYKLLNLDCPILSTYELDDSERHFAELLGIQPDSIKVDTRGEISAQMGILPKIGGLRPLFFDFLSEMPKGPSPVGPNVYITREQSTDRIMQNESTVHEIVEQHGFDIVAMEDFTLEDQMAIASNANTIVSPHGAGLANMVFARKETKIVELIPDRYMTPLFKQLSVDCGHQYSVVLGKVQQNGDKVETELKWDVNLDTLENVLNSLAA